jgi:hypothetical protein
VSIPHLFADFIPLYIVSPLVDIENDYVGYKFLDLLIGSGELAVDFDDDACYGLLKCKFERFSYHWIVINDQNFHILRYLFLDR